LVYTAYGPSAPNIVVGEKYLTLYDKPFDVILTDRNAVLAHAEMLKKML